MDSASRAPHNFMEAACTNMRRKPFVFIGSVLHLAKTRCLSLEVDSGEKGYGVENRLTFILTFSPALRVLRLGQSAGGKGTVYWGCASALPGCWAQRGLRETSNQIGESRGPQ